MVHIGKRKVMLPRIVINKNKFKQLNKYSILIFNRFFTFFLLLIYTYLSVQELPPKVVPALPVAEAEVLCNGRVIPDTLCAIKAGPLQ